MSTCIEGQGCRLLISARGPRQGNATGSMSKQNGNGDLEEAHREAGHQKLLVSVISYRREEQALTRSLKPIASSLTQML